jgi:two-component system chemotaxis family response regulator WspR
VCLKKMAATLAGVLKRPADLAARYGGEEFALVLPDTNSEGARQLAETCRSHLERQELEHPGEGCGIVTMSIGVATIVPTKHNSVETLIANADKALYAAKDGGRNRVVVSELD